jgi:dTDP-4-amino-4,6-dideoxygalactose transaminase
MIGSRLVYPPVSKQVIYPTEGTFPVTEDYCARGLWLPSSSFLSDEIVDRVCAEIRTYFGGGKGAS